MNQTSLWILSILSIKIAVFHTLVGVDHTLPFVVLGRSQHWSHRKTLLVTFFCGLGHVLSSVLLGLLGLRLGMLLSKLQGVESLRGNWAAWLLIFFGLAYTVWALSQKRKNLQHLHQHNQGELHSHVYDSPLHVHSENENHTTTQKTLFRWTARSLFLAFVLGPCEPLIPLLMFPSFQWGWTGVLWIAFLFSSATIGTMLVIVSIGFKGMSVHYFQRFEQNLPVFAGLSIALSGIAIQLFGI